MAEGGGFCERHGPYDPPHRSCPYCALEDHQRQAYGPPGAPSRDEFARRTLEPEPPEPEAPELTELRAMDEDDEADLPPDDEGPLPMGWLIVKEPAERRGTVVQIAANQTIGRAGDIQWDDPRLSRQHARITLEPAADDPDARPAFHLWPFGPTNPVFINGGEVRGATPLHENDEIRLGDTLFVFKVLGD